MDDNGNLRDMVTVRGEGGRGTLTFDLQLLRVFLIVLFLLFLRLFQDKFWFKDRLLDFGLYWELSIKRDTASGLVHGLMV